MGKEPDWPELSAYTAKSNFKKQFAAVTDRANFLHICAAIRTGKTFGAARAFMLRLIRDRRRFNPMGTSRSEPLLYWVLGPTYKQTRAQKQQLINLIPSWQVDWARQGKSELFWNLKRGEGIVFLKGNVTIELRSAEDAESLVADKVRGFWVTEAARVKQTALQNLDGRIANYADGWGIYDTSPFGHCAYYIDYAKKAMEGEAPSSAYYEWDAYESPHVPNSKIEEAKERMAPSFFRRDFLASWDTFQGQIYHEWDDRVHTFDKCPFQPNRAYICVDLNTSAEHPAAFCTMLARGTGEDTEAFIESEYYKYGLGLDFDGYAKTIAAKAKSFKKHGYRVKVIVDPSVHTRFKDMLYKEDVNPKNGKNAIIPGIRTMGSALHPRKNRRPMLTVSKSCTNFANEIKGYSWTVASDGIVKERPDKGKYDHLMDAARYGCMDVFSHLTTARQVK